MCTAYFLNAGIFLSVVFACNNKNEKTQSRYHPKVMRAVAYFMPKDSLKKADPITGKLDLAKKCGTPSAAIVTQNTFTPLPPIVITLPKKLPEVTPGKDGYALPKVMPASYKIVIAGIPEVVVAKDMGSKNKNSANFSYFKMLQGLKQSSVKRLFIDKSGNMWMANGTAGVCKYDGKYFTYYTEKQGLASNIVQSICEDKKGNLWFGTNGGGASCYNGKEFLNFTVKEGLLSNIITDVCEDKYNNIWFACELGATCYNPSAGPKAGGKTFTHYTKKEGLTDNSVGAFLLDSKKNLWLATDNGACIFNGTSFIYFRETAGMYGANIYNLDEDKAGNIWFGSYNTAVFCYSPTGKTVTRYFVENGLTSNTIWSTFADKKGNVWFGTEKGLTKFDAKALLGKGGKLFTRYTETEGLSNDAVHSICQDNNGELWFGTNDGLNRYDGDLFMHFTEAEGLPQCAIVGAIQSKNGALWFATYGNGLYKYDTLARLSTSTLAATAPGGKTFFHLGLKEGFDNPVAWGLYEDSKGNKWTGTRGAGSLKYFNDSLQVWGNPGRFVYCHYEDKAGNLWFGTYTEGVTMYNGKEFKKISIGQGLSDASVYSILEDKKGNMWFGTRFNGVNCYTPATSPTAPKFIKQFTVKQGLSNSTVNCLFEDERGNIWMGTDGGLCIYTGKLFIHFTEKEGLVNNFVNSILKDKNGNLWFGTQGGISKINKDRLVVFYQNNLKLNDKPLFKNYGYTDGFLGINCPRNAVVEDNNGYIWWGTNDRLTRYDPAGDVEDTLAPEMSITSIKLFNEPITWKNVEAGKDTTLSNGAVLKNIYFDSLSRWYNLPEKLSLPYDNNYLTFNFIGLHLKSSGSIVYQYKLEGLEKNWSSVTKNTEIPYTNLPPGKYTFKVKAMNKEGYWSAPFAYTFKIRPPWWQTWLFRILVLAVLILAVRYYIKWRERTLTKRQKLLERTVEERTAEVTEQKYLIEEKQKEIIDSINYAKRIQYTLLAHEKVLTKNLAEHFVLFRPKDIVSGDFYWATSVNSKQLAAGENLPPANCKLFYLAVCDSTGHGVPGAFMSLLNISFLNEAITERHIEKPNEILNYVRQRLTESISKEGNKDGFDGILLCMETSPGQETKITYAASNNSPVLIKNGIFYELDADRMPVGVGERKEDFKLHTIDFTKGEMLYLYTDGYADQFGGPKGKKFKYKKLNDLLLSVWAKPVPEQKEILLKQFEEWKGSLEQVDDVCIIGIKL